MEKLNEILGMSVYRYIFCIYLCVFFIGGLLCVWYLFKAGWGVCIRPCFEGEHIYSSIQAQRCSGLSRVSVSMPAPLLWRCLDTHCYSESWKPSHTHVHIHIHTYTQMYINHLLILTPCLSFIVVTKHLRKWSIAGCCFLRNRSCWL